MEFDFDLEDPAYENVAVKEVTEKVEEVVEQILRKDEYARNNDVYLILRYISKVYPYEIGKKFEEAMTNVSKKGLSFESITRARRKLQSK